MTKAANGYPFTIYYLGSKITNGTRYSLKQWAQEKLKNSQMKRRMITRETKENSQNLWSVQTVFIMFLVFIVYSSS